MAGVIKDLLGSLTQWVYKYWLKMTAIKKEQSKNADAIEQQKKAETKDERDDANEAIARRFNKH